MTNREFKTDDLALIAYLFVEGFHHTEARPDGRTSPQGLPIVDVFFDWTPDLDDAVADYKTGNAEVEPREFQRKVARVRRILREAA